MREIITSVIICLIVLAMLPAAFLFARHSCETTAGLMGLKWDYSFFSDCVIKVDGKYVPLSRVRISLNKTARDNNEQ